MPTPPRGTEGEIVPLRDRLQQLHLFRLLVLFGLLIGLGLGPLKTPTPVVTVGGIFGYGIITTLGLVAWVRARGRRLPLLGMLLLADGVLLLAARVLVADPNGILVLLPMLHVVVVALLGSYSTGWKICVWHTLLFLIGQEVVAAGLFPSLGLETRPVGGPILVMWGAMLLTSAASGLNERELRRQRHDLAALAAFSQHVQSCVTPDEVAAALHEGLAADSDGQVLVYDPSTEVVIAGPGVGEVHRVAGAALMVEVVDTPATTLVERFDPDRDGWLATLLPGAENIVVLTDAGPERAGLIVVLADVATQASRVQRRVVAAMERTLAYGSLAYGNATLRADLAARAATDGLTGIPNRATFDSRLAAETERARRTDDHVSLLLMDIDRFKPFNDTYGHVAGDKAIQLVASTLAASGRPYDLAARYGGEEFAVILPHTNLADAVGVGERFRAAIEAIDGAAAPVTVSVGVASTELTWERESLVKLADGALYRAKDGGRNTVRVADIDDDVRSEHKTAAHAE